MLNRYDFATEEEWQGYKSEQQNMPKAAFQFGVKKGDGRLSHKSLLKKQDAKIAGDLSKIKGVFKVGSKDLFYHYCFTEVFYRNR